MRSSTRTPLATVLLALALGSAACEKADTATPADAAATDPQQGALDGEVEPEEAVEPEPEPEPEPVLTVTLFEETVQEHMQDVLDCYGEAQAKSKKLAGKLVAEFKIDGDGKVTEVLASGGSTLKDPGLLTCIQERAANWDLAKPPGGEPTNMRFPFELAPG